MVEFILLKCKVPRIAFYRKALGSGPQFKVTHNWNGNKCNRNRAAQRHAWVCRPYQSACNAIVQMSEGPSEKNRPRSHDNPSINALALLQLAANPSPSRCTLIDDVTEQRLERLHCKGRGGDCENDCWRRCGMTSVRCIMIYVLSLHCSHAIPITSQLTPQIVPVLYLSRAMKKSTLMHILWCKCV